MTASDCTPEQGNESGGSIDTEFSPFEQFARREIATQFRVKPSFVEEASREIAEDIDEGRQVDPEDVQELRNEARELLRLADRALLASGDEEDVNRTGLSQELLGRGNDVDEGVKHLSSAVLNEEGLKSRDLDMVLGYLEKLERTVVEVAEKCPREDS
jgi:hypothetical protein